MSEPEVLSPLLPQTWAKFTPDIDGHNAMLCISLCRSFTASYLRLTISELRTITSSPSQRYHEVSLLHASLQSAMTSSHRKCCTQGLFGYSGYTATAWPRSPPGLSGTLETQVLRMAARHDHCSGPFPSIPCPSRVLANTKLEKGQGASGKGMLRNGPVRGHWHDGVGKALLTLWEMIPHSTLGVKGRSLKSACSSY